MKSKKLLNFKRVLNLIYTGGGTILIIVLVVFTAGNFVKYSVVFGKPIASPVPTAAKIEPTVAPTDNSGKIIEKDFTVDTSGGLPQSSSTTVVTNNAKPATPKPTPRKVMIRVINYTGDSATGEEVRRLLETRGYSVSTETAVSSGKVSTKIINLHEKKYGSIIYGILKRGWILDEFDPNSKYDVVVIIGDDYNGENA